MHGTIQFKDYVYFVFLSFVLKRNLHKYSMNFTIWTIKQTATILLNLAKVRRKFVVNDSGVCYEI